MSMKRIALTLPGGGARAAYQAGVLRAIADICKFKQSPFSIISGVSAGGINGMWMAAGAEDFVKAANLMCADWKDLAVSDVYKTDAMTLVTTGVEWARNLSFGGLFRKSSVTYLLDTSPLRKLLKDKIDFNKINANLDNGLIQGLSLTATDYQTNTATTFFTGSEEIKPWKHLLSTGVRDRLSVEHIMASAALPILFPPITIGERDYGDGGIGLKTPMSPAIHMGATKILIIGVQNPTGAESEKDTAGRHRATLGDVSGTLLNSLFLSSLDADIDRLKKINHTVSLFKSEQLLKDSGLRNIPILAIRPSRDLSRLGVSEFAHFPFTIRHLLKGLGITDQKGWDLLSYIAFDRVFTKALLDLGYSDGMDAKADVETFFAED
jgi:NTE family protein